MGLQVGEREWNVKKKVCVCIGEYVCLLVNIIVFVVVVFTHSCIVYMLLLIIIIIIL